MKKNWGRMGKGLMFVLVIGAVSLFSFCIIKMNRMQVTLNELMSQLFYLQDSVSVLQSDMGTMETNIEAALEEESSMIEDFSVSLRDFDFEKGTYAVDITVLPKEYTEATQLTVYFGTKGCNLELQGILFKGSATLSVKNNYDGNVTVLITNGEKRNTEVINNYKDFQTILTESLGGFIDGVEDSYRDGVWEFNGSVSYELDGQGSFEFTSFHLIAEAGGEAAYDYDLIRETGGAIETDTPEEKPTEEMSGQEDAFAQGGEPEDTAPGDTAPDVQEDSPESAADAENADDAADAAELPDGAGDAQADGTAEQETAVETDESISGETGTQDVSFSCRAEETDTVKIYLTAVTKEGITLRLTLFEGALSGDAKTEAADIADYTPVLDYYDKNNMRYE
jgi:hypothetical protein